MTIASEKILSAFTSIANRTHQVFFIYDRTPQELSYINQAVEQFIPMRSEALKGNPAALLEWIHPQDREYVIGEWKDLLAGQEKKNIEFRLLLPYDEVKWVCMTAYPFGEEQESITGFVEEITSSREYVKNLLKYNAKKDSTLEILSHDLASPMNTIEGLVKVIAKRTQHLKDEDLNKITQVVMETCRKGVDLIRDFVAAEFLESSQVDVVKKRYNLAEKIGIVMDNYKGGEKNIPKKFHFISERKELFAHFDDMKFMQVINNLISNAIKFTPDGGTITTQLEDKGQYVLISIADNGIGIPKDMQEGLFDKFTKARRPGLKGEKSTGLGMSISKTIVEWHGGKIWLESEENKGTTFFIQIPKE